MNKTTITRAALALTLTLSTGLFACSSADENQEPGTTENKGNNSAQQALEAKWDATVSGSKTASFEGTGVGVTYTSAIKRASVILDTDTDAVAGENAGPLRLSLQLNQANQGETGKFEGAGNIVVTGEFSGLEAPCTPAQDPAASSVELTTNEEGVGIAGTFNVVIGCVAADSTEVSYTIAGSFSSPDAL